MREDITMHVRTTLILTAIAALSMSGSPAAAQVLTRSGQEMLRELREIRAILMVVRADIAELKKEIQKKKESDEEDEDLTNFGNFRKRSANPAKLRAIKLPENPSEDQIKDYVQEIMTASRGQNSFSSADPQVRMLTRVGAEHLNLLLDSMGQPGEGRHFGGRYHVQEAILKLAEEGHKKLILDSLSHLTFLVKVVLDKGWERDAREVLLQELASAPQQLPMEWVQAVANLRDAETYDDLKWYLINRNGRHNTYQAIRHLPDIDLADAVAKAWGKTGHHEWEERGIAKIAIEYGHLDAMEYLVNFLADEHQNRWEVSGIRQLVLRHLDFYGSNKEMAEWIKKNEDQLIFDKKTKKFTIAQNGKTRNQKGTTE